MAHRPQNAFQVVRRQTFLLAVASAGFLAVVGLELSPPWNVIPARDVTDSVPPPGFGRPGPGESSDETVADILARPLFSPDRVAAPNDRSAGPGQTADLPRLSGILIASDSRRAIFQPVGTGRAKVVEEGETVGAWRVQQIAVGAITVTGAAGTYRLTPKFDAQPASAGPVDAPAQRPVPPNPAGAVNFANQAQPGLPNADPRRRPPDRGPSPDGSVFGGASGHGNRSRV
jgi:hypothetical protein